MICFGDLKTQLFGVQHSSKLKGKNLNTRNLLNNGIGHWWGSELFLDLKKKKKKKNMEGLIPDFNNILDKLLGLYIKM